MKVTGIALIVIAVAMLLFAGISFLVLSEPSSGSTPEPSPPFAQVFSPLLAIIVAVISGGAGVAMLMFGGKGYTEKPPVSPVRTS